MIGKKDDAFLLLLIPHLDSSEGIWVFLLRQRTVEHDDLVFEDGSVLWNRLLFHYGVIGIVLLPRHEKDPFFVPPGKEGIIRIAPVAGNYRSFRKGEILCNGDLMDAPLRDMGKDGEIAVMVEEEVELDRPLGLTERCPIEQRSAEVDDRGIQTKELVLEAEFPLARRNGPALVEKLIEHLLVELPGSFLVGVGQRGPGGGCVDAEMLQLAQTA